MHYRSVTCPYCNSKLRYRSSQTESKINCPGCHRKFYSNQSSLSGRSKSQSDADNFYDVSFRGGKLFSLLIPSKHADRLYLGGIALLLLLILGGAVLLGSMLSRGSPSLANSQAKQLTHTEVPTASSNLDPRTADVTDTANLFSSKILGNLVPVSTTTPFTYRLEKGRRFVYDLVLRANNGPRSYSIAGELSFSIKADAKPHDEEALGSGTAFVISSNGILATCAHVVQDAEEVSIVIGEDTYSADVVAFDRLRDVALLRISANGLPALPLAQSDEIQLAQQVRVIGYPLPGLLGTGVRINSGTVTGGVEDLGSGKQRFQVDATINPGNSGGPFVDDTGAVIGIAIALFSGIRVNEVGIAVPVAEVRHLLSGLNVYSTSETQRGALSGTDLAQKVVRSVAMVKVKRNESATNRYRVIYKWEQIKGRTSNQNRFISTLSPSLLLEAKRFPETVVGSFDVNHMGEISDYEGNIVLPLCYEQLGKLVFEELSGAVEPAWVAMDFGHIEIAPISRPYGSESEYSQGSSTPKSTDVEERSQVTRLRGEDCATLDKIDYSIEEETESLAKISALRKFSTLGEQKPPRLMLEGKRQIEFDKDLGLIRHAKFEAVVQEHMRDDRQLQIPYSVELKLKQLSLQ
ncbi:S1C family serine protease [Bythopirellula goksoeyrii]|uniref:Serine protease HtrA n=1 Tax=Bythopirellula goksoeyrii TaxID=1400387 RepID=A0A5B9QG24_9BACT|nr:serine protease [Bythopirellula goksoeyrii]QEG33223.1 Putative serine protease HtrA [Bythopirellula goksoeyrii]